MRTISGTLLAAQQATQRKPYIRVVINSVDYSDRVLFVEHHEEPYRDYATIILQNADRGLDAISTSGSNLLGVNALMYTLIGYIAILPHKLFHIESVILSPIVIFIFYLIKAFIYMILAYIFFTTNSLAVYFNTIFMGEFIYTILISIPVFFIFKNIYSFMEKLKRYV